MSLGATENARHKAWHFLFFRIFVAYYELCDMNATKGILTVLATALLWSCANMDYDTSKGIDKEMTLFSDQIGLPLADIGPITPRVLFQGAGLDKVLPSSVQEDEDGYLCVVDEESIYNNFTMILSLMTADPSAPSDFADVVPAGKLDDAIVTLEALGMALSPQTFTLNATNPLTEGIAVSGKLTLSSRSVGTDPADTLTSQEFTKSAVGAQSKDQEILRIERSGGMAIYNYSLENFVLHLPASIMGLDPESGMGVFSVSYRYKSYIALGSDFPASIPVDVDDLNIKLGQYKVKEATIRTEVANEIPLTLELESVQVHNNDSLEVSVTPGLVIASGCSGNPVVSPLEIEIKAVDGTIPDISGLTLNLGIKAPTGTGDNRLVMNQTLYFNNIRVAVSGGITFQDK